MINLNGLPANYNEVNVTISDLNGQVILNQVLQTKQSGLSKIYPINLERFSPGMYFVSISLEGVARKNFKISKD